MAETLSIPRLANLVPDEASAYKLLESLRWGDESERQFCPHCGAKGVHYYIRPLNGSDRKTRTGSNSERRVWKCSECRKQFSVLTGTVFHGTKISLRTIVLVVFQLVASKNGVSAREIERTYGLTPKTAWFLLHRIREGMKLEPLVGMLSGVVLADETFIGGVEKNKHKSKRNPAEPTQLAAGQTFKRGPKGDKTSVLSLLDTTTGEVRSRVVPDVTGHTLRKVISEQVDMANTVLVTDEAKGYKTFAPELAGHETVNHSQDEYVRYPKGAAPITTNNVEGYFSQLKRSLDGTHHHVSAKHLERYLGEFDFRYSTRELTDTGRMYRLMGQVGGRRLTYRPIVEGR